MTVIEILDADWLWPIMTHPPHYTFMSYDVIKIRDADWFKPMDAPLTTNVILPSMPEVAKLHSVSRRRHTCLFFSQAIAPFVSRLLLVT